MFIDVDMTLAVLDEHQRATIRLVAYPYHAGVEGQANRPIFRYDNAHGYPGHGDAYHKHHFDHPTWTRIDPPEWIGEERCPRLADVIYDLEDWWGAAGQHLDLEE